MNRILVLGLDGVCWDFLNPWIEKGHLPNIERLRCSGCWGVLKSVLPPVTCPAWKCYSTGKNPGKLGVYWWVGWDHDSGKIVPPNSTSFRSRDVWDYIGDAGLKVAVINMPTTYPPKKVNGVMVAGFGSPLDIDFDYRQKYTYPDSLQKELEDKYGYRPGIPVLETEDKEKLVTQVSALIESRFKYLLDILESGEFDFIHFTLFYINALQHHLGSDDLVLGVWKKIDSWIGEIAKYDYTLILMSDHGMMPIKSSFCINKWLEELGYLRFKAHSGRGNSILNLVYRKSKFIVKTAKLLLPAFIKKRLIPKVAGRIPTMLLDEYVDWDNSMAVALSQGPIYFNRKNILDMDGFRKKLARELANLEMSGVKPVEKVFTRDEAYSGRYLDKAPDLLVVASYGFEIYGGLTDGKIVDHGDMRGWSTGNHPDGFFLMHGPEIKETGAVDEISILDLSPTILHLMNQQIPSDMDGIVQNDFFKEGSGAAKNEVIKKITDLKVENAIRKGGFNRGL